MRVSQRNWFSRTNWISSSVFATDIPVLISSVSAIFSCKCTLPYGKALCTTWYTHLDSPQRRKLQLAMSLRRAARDFAALRRAAQLADGTVCSIFIQQLDFASCSAAPRSPNGFLALKLLHRRNILNPLRWVTAANRPHAISRINPSKTRRWRQLAWRHRQRSV